MIEMGRGVWGFHDRSPGSVSPVCGDGRGGPLSGESSSNSPTADADSGGGREFRPHRTAPATF